MGAVVSDRDCATDRLVGQLTASVVVPVRNDAVELRGLLECLAAQTHTPLEIIVVDNGSTDQTAALARRAGCEVVSEPREGIARAVHSGYDAARGDLIVRCDADSRPPPRWLASHVAAHVRAAAGTVAVTGPGWFSAPPVLRLLLTVGYLGAYITGAGAALGHVPLFGTTMSMRREWWLRVRGQASRSSRVHDDMDLSFLIAPHERVLYTFGVGVRMSTRALRGGAAASVRWRRAGATLMRAWGREWPWDRWRARIARTSLTFRRLCSQRVWVRR